MDSVLIVDDNRGVLNVLGENLRNAGFSPIAAGDGLAGLRQFYHHQPNMVILDVEMPGMDGWTLTVRIREVSDVPLIMLTASDTEQDKLRAFALGVDDYVTKPFSSAEIVARVHALLKRTNGNSSHQSTTFTRGDLTIDLDGRRLTKNGQTVHLTPTEFQLLSVLVRHAGRPLPHEYLLSEVWGTGYEGEVEHIKHYVWSLRQKLEDEPASPCHLLTVRGFGYRFE